MNLMENPPPDPHLAFTRLFVAAQPALHGFLMSLVHDLHAADDLLQDLAERMWRKFDDYDVTRPFVAWGIGFARLLAMEWRRKQQRLAIPLDDETLARLADQAADDIPRQDERRHALRDCLRQLTDLQRRTIHTRYHDEIPVPEIARAWKRSEMAIYQTLKRAHAALLDCITQTLASHHHDSV